MIFKPTKTCFLFLLKIMLLMICLNSYYSTITKSTKFFKTLKAISNLVKDQNEMRGEIAKIDQYTNTTLTELKSNYSQMQSQLTKEFQSESEQISQKLNKRIDLLLSNYEKLLNHTETNRQKISEYESKIEISASNQFRFFRIINAKNSKCLTDTGKGNQISLQECKSEKSNPAQAWKIWPSADGWYAIISANNKALDVFNAKKTSGNIVQSWDLNLSEAQRWALDPIGDFFFLRIIGNNCLRLDFDEHTSQVVILDCKGQGKDSDYYHQQFYFNVYRS